MAEAEGGVTDCTPDQAIPWNIDQGKEIQE